MWEAALGGHVGGHVRPCGRPCSLRLSERPHWEAVCEAMGVQIGRMCGRPKWEAELGDHGRPCEAELGGHVRPN